MHAAATLPLRERVFYMSVPVFQASERIFGAVSNYRRCLLRWMVLFEDFTIEGIYYFFPLDPKTMEKYMGNNP